MKKYNFLFKPVFFIFSLFFATWLVIKIEKLSPSDFGDHGLGTPLKANNPEKFSADKKCLKNICIAYKKGIIDSTKLDRKLTLFLESIKNDSVK